MLTAVLEGKNAKVNEEYFYFRGDASSASDKLSPTIPSEICLVSRQWVFSDHNQLWRFQVGNPLTDRAQDSRLVGC